MSPAEADSICRQFRLDEVEVTAAEPAAQSREQGAQTLSGEELRRMSALTVADALRYFAGVQLKDYGGVGGIKTINVRSMGSQHVGVFYNGIQLGNAQNGQVDLGRFSLENMEEIQLYNGQKTDLLQSAREMGCAGTIYLQTRRPYFPKGERVHARVGMRGGSFGLVNPLLGLELNLLGKRQEAKGEGQEERETQYLYLTLDAEYLQANGRYEFRYKRVTPSGQVAYDTTAVRENGDIRGGRIELGLHHYYRTTGYWRLHLYNYLSDRGIPGAIVNNVWRNGERQADRNTFAQLHWQDRFFRIWQAKALMKYANDYTHYRNLDYRLLPADNQYWQQEVYMSLINRVQLLYWWDMAVAYDMQWNSLNRQEGTDEQQPAVTDHYERWSHYLSAAINMNVRDILRVQLSALMTHIDSTTRVTPGAFLTLKPWHRVDLRLNAFYKQSYRYPTFNDLYYTDRGNADLRPELARQHNIGLSYALPFHVAKVEEASALELRADYYYNHVTDKIVAYPKGQQFRWTMLNLGNVKINGVDALLTLALALPQRWALSLKGQYTYQRALDVTNPRDSYYGDQIPYIPEHSGSAVAGLNWHAKRGDLYGLNYSFVYVGERYCQQENTVYNYVQPWYTHDLALYGDWGVRNHRIKATLEINNLLGQDYEVIKNYPMPKQNIRCTITIQY